MVSRMASALFNTGRDGFLIGTFAWTSMTPFAVLYDILTGGAGAPALTTQYLGSVTGVNADGTQGSSTNLCKDDATPANNRIGSPVSQSAQGIADGADVAMAVVATHAACAGIIIAREIGGSQGTPANDDLIVWLDTATGLPVTPNGGAITIAWANSGNYIFKL